MIHVNRAFRNAIGAPLRHRPPILSARNAFITRRAMNIPDWLDQKEKEGIDVSQLELPEELLFDAVPDETVYFKTYNPCSILCAREHPYATVERYGRWYYCRGQDKKAGIHAKGMEWRFITRDKDLAIRTARSRIE